MPRTIPSDLLDHLQGDHITVALAVKLTRRDGTVMGFTSSSRDVTLNGVTYEAQSAANPTALRSLEGTAVDNLEVAGLIQSDSITVADIRAGLYRHAQVEMFLFNYKDTSQGVITLPVFSVSQITYQDNQWTFELRSMAARMAQQVCDLTSPYCRVRELFNGQCFVGGTNYDTGLVPGDFLYNATITGVLQSGLILNLLLTDDLASGWLDEGKATFLTGDNAIANLSKEIKLQVRVSSTSAQITLHEVFPFAVQVGDTLTVQAGCDRRAETCRDKFANLGNFRGEPQVPGLGQILVRGRR